MLSVQLKNMQKYHFVFLFLQNTTLDKMCKYENDQDCIIKDTEKTQLRGQMGGRTDGWT